MDINLARIKKIFFIGIGGIGVSAVARMMHFSGKKVSGSDTTESIITKKLSELGIHIYIGHAGSNIPADTDLVIHTIAIPENNPEIVEAKKRQIRVVTYPYMLSVISKDMYTIAISGTHGKTTTTAMLSRILTNTGYDPTVIVGSLMKNLDENSDSNFIHGKSKYFVVEACEYRRSFLNLYPTILAITNIEEDHLDYYADISDIQSAFRELTIRIPKDGCIVCNPSDPQVQPILQDVQCAVVDYMSHAHANLTLAVPGKHNRLNAGVALAIAQFLGAPKERAIESISHFRGTWRRFDCKGKTKRGALLYDDYAHHPTEIRATLQGLREMFPNKRRVLFFQPHQYSRTKLLFLEFLKSFDDADVVYILPIFPARESFDPSITSQMLVEQINDSKVMLVNSLTEAEEIIRTQDENTVVMTMGAGDVYTICENVIG